MYSQRRAHVIFFFRIGCFFCIGFWIGSFTIFSIGFLIGLSIFSIIGLLSGTGGNCFFENIGDSYNHQFIYEGEGEGIDLSGYSIPKLIDIDNDLDLDLFIGSMNGQIAFYENES